MAVWMKAALFWIAILAFAIVNGALRESFLIPSMGSFAGLIVSGILLSTCIFLVAWIAAPWYGSLAAHQWIGIGLFWLLLTLIFEFGFGRYVQHKTWDELLDAYTFQGGNIWPLVLVATGIAPWIVAKVRGL